MALGFIQVDFQFVDGQAIDLATELGIPKREAIGYAIELWAWMLKRGRAEEPPTGLIKGEHANKRVELAVNWAGEPNLFVNAAVKCGLIELINDGLRIRGASRYLATFRKQQSDRERMQNKRHPQQESFDGPSTVDRNTKTNTNTNTKTNTNTNTTNQQVDLLKQAWNELRVEPMPEWQRTGKKRAAAARARLKEYSLEEIREAIAALTQSRWHTGSNPNSWAAGPDWLLRPDNIGLMLERRCSAKPQARIVQPDEDLWAQPISKDAH